MEHERGAFRNVIRSSEVDAALPVDAYLAELDAFIDAHNPYRVNKVIAAIGDGSAPLAVVKRYAKELYYLGLWMTPEFALLVANAPDRYALTLEHSEHYAHWCQNFADETGYLRDPKGIQLKTDCIHFPTEAQAAGFLLIVVTNQGAVAKGRMTQEDSRSVNEKVAQDMKKSEVSLHDFFVCPHHSEGVIAEFSLPCVDRKTNP